MIDFGVLLFVLPKTSENECCRLSIASLYSSNSRSVRNMSSGLYYSNAWTAPRTLYPHTVPAVNRYRRSGR